MSRTCCVALTLENSALAGGTKYLVGRMLYVNPQTHHMAPYVSNLSHISSMFLTPEQWFFLWQIFTISRKRIFCHKFHDFKENPKKKIQTNCPNWLQYERMLKIFYFHILKGYSEGMHDSGGKSD